MTALPKGIVQGVDVSEVANLGNLKKPVIPYIMLDEEVKFPVPKDRQVNMMPFLAWHPEMTLPKNLKPYIKMIRSITSSKGDSLMDPVGHVLPWDEVWYLTVQEGWVEKGKTQRRPGLHIESPGSLVTESGTETTWEGGWGGGSVSAETPGEIRRSGGLYIASSVADTTRVWNYHVKKTKGVVGPGGDLEAHRNALGGGTLLPANRLTWLTDRTPHEAVPMTRGGYRQFFRLVTSDVSVWYADHSTANPIGIQPTGLVVQGDKFELMKGEGKSSITKPTDAENEKRIKKVSKANRQIVTDMSHRAALLARKRARSGKKRISSVKRKRVRSRKTTKRRSRSRSSKRRSASSAAASKKRKRSASAGSKKVRKAARSRSALR